METVADRGPLTAKSLSASTQINLPTAYHLLRTLVHEDYLCRLGDGRYALGHQFMSVTLLEGKARSICSVRELMTELAGELRAHVLIGVVDEGEILVWNAVENPATPPINCWPGTRLPAHATALGKSILSQMPPKMRAEQLRRHPLRAWTSQTALTAERLEGGLAAGGIARSEQEYIYGVSCVAAALDGLHDYAAVSVAYPSTRSLPVRARTEDLLVRAADRISAALVKGSAAKPTKVAAEAV